MSLRHIGAWLLRRWPLVGGGLILVAVLLSLALSLSGSRGILAQAEPTPLVITEETMHLLPPFDPNAIPTIARPPCMEELDRKYDGYPYVTLGYGRNGNCHIRVDDRYLTESQTDELVARREAATRARRAQRDEEAEFRAYLASIREISFNDGTTVKLPRDVRVDNVLLRHVLCADSYCPGFPQYRLIRGQSCGWMGMGSCYGSTRTGPGI